MGCRRRFGYGQDGYAVASIGVLLVVGLVLWSKTIIPEAKAHPLHLLQETAFYTPSFGGFGLRQEL